ncbi:gag/pol protein [Cucumis melo var. makuwa]|uniref:Gag/pol protein n=1 Tax=Cucumis melo var. makuwa TaxID=1194695 RepID=A0A5D3DJU5_CUCMM|nr:gag/pol protein [Cucumis melo var. makuwa]
MDKDEWIKAMNLKLEPMYFNLVWDLVDQPDGGYTQVEGVDYKETFSPVAKLNFIQILLSIAAYYDYEIWQMDVKIVFLNGNLEETIYMQQPEGFITLRQEQKVMLCTRSDICYAVGIVSSYQSNPGLAHWTAVKTILKYLRRTRDYMLVYGSKDFILTGYTDFDFKTYRNSRKSASGLVFTVNKGNVVWRSIKQVCITDSTIEAEYVATCEATKEIV